MSFVKKLFIAAFVLLVIVVLLFIIFVVEPGKYPKATFSSTTGIELPDSANTIYSIDSHGGLSGDGNLILVSELSENDIQDLLSTSPPWGEEWKPGPLTETEVDKHMLFGQLEDSISDYPYRDEGYQDPNFKDRIKQRDELFVSSDIFYTVNFRNSTRNGDIIILDSVNNRIWFSSWDS